MMNVFILKKDKDAYVSLMLEACGGARIHEELEDKLLVDFCNNALTTWQDADMWLSFV